jgi:hypothetical protein
MNPPFGDWIALNMEVRFGMRLESVEHTSVNAQKTECHRKSELDRSTQQIESCCTITGNGSRTRPRYVNWNGEWVEITTLEASGCNLHTEKRQDLLKMTLNGFGVRMNYDAMEVHATAQTFPLRKHNLIQAMLAVNDLFDLAKPIVASLFFEDVVAWLDANDIRYTPMVKFTGISGYDQLFVI